MFEALRNSGYRYLKFRVFGKPLGYGILRADVCDDTITLSLIIKGNSGENLIWDSAKREFYDYLSCVEAIKDCEAKILKSPLDFPKNRNVRYDFEGNPNITYLNTEI